MQRVSSSSPLLSQEDYFEACRLTFNSFSKTTPNKLTKTEFNTLLKHLQNQLNFPLNDKLLEQIFIRVDQDKDGLIELDEFFNALSSYYYQNWAI